MENFLEKDSIHSFKEIYSHNKESDGWIIIDKKIYNISNFIQLHPGGKEIILPYLGNDVTEVFKTNKVHLHSQKAWKILSNYLIGTIEGEKIVINQNLKLNQKDSIDLDKPLITQVKNMNPNKYQEWIHNTSFISDNKDMRIFESNFFEKFSHYPWWYIWPLWAPVIILLIYFGYMSCHSVKLSILSFLLGCLFWGFLEYLIHRFLFHMKTNSTIGNLYHLFAHGIHHLSPLDSTRLTFPPIFSIFVVSLSYELLIQLNSFFPTIQIFGAGILSGFVMYDTLHYYFHHGKPFWWNSYFTKMKSRHLNHHYKNPDKNFGVTSPLFDLLFGTSDT
jgi:4-hydroxysphinganine ceramide fatty acyl 2-hydroxylase